MTIAIDNHVKIIERLKFGIKFSGIKEGDKLVTCLQEMENSLHQLEEEEGIGREKFNNSAKEELDVMREELLREYACKKPGLGLSDNGLKKYYDLRINYLDRRMQDLAACQ